MTVADPFTATSLVPRGSCAVCGHITPMLRDLIERHKERRFKASKGGEYISDTWCSGSGSVAEFMAEPEGAAA